MGETHTGTASGTDQPPQPHIIDAQVNLASELAVPRSFIEYQGANAHHRLAAHGHSLALHRVIDQVASLYQDDDADQLVAELDAAGVAQAFLIAPDFSHAATCALSPPELAELHHRITLRHPGRFLVFWGVDPRAGQDGLDLFERCVREYGFVGMKLYPPCGYAPSDRRLYPYFELCAQYGLPVLSHTGPGWGPLDFSYGEPLLLDTAARDFPTVDFILGHGGVTHVDEASYLCAHRPNVYLDISQFHSVLSADGWQHHLNRLFRSGISHKILFGTCWPSYRQTRSLASLVKEFGAQGSVFSGVKRAEQRLIMSGNSRRLLDRRRTEGGE